MAELETVTFTISGVTMKQFETSTKYILQAEDGKKYIFYSHKKDGGTSKAYEQYTQRQMRTGMTVSAAVASENKSFRDQKDGKIYEYVEHKVMFFPENEGQVPERPQVQPKPQTEDILLPMKRWAKEFERRTAERNAEVDKRLKELENMRTLLVEKFGEPAVDLHASMGGQEPKKEQSLIDEMNLSLQDL